MNALIYNLLNKTNEYRILDDECLDKLYEYYLDASEKLKFDIHIVKDDFNLIISTIYDVLRFKITDDEFLMCVEYYLTLLVADAHDNNVVDNIWAINHLWYLCISNDLPYEKYNDCIIFIQNKLLKELDIHETFSKKISRRIYVSLFTK